MEKETGFPGRRATAIEDATRAEKGVITTLTSLFLLSFISSYGSHSSKSQWTRASGKHGYRQPSVLTSKASKAWLLRNADA